MPPEVDFDRLLASLKDLSELVVDDDTQVTPVPSGAQLCVLEPIPLKLYRNGIMMFDGPFRPFHDPATQVGVGEREDRPAALPTLFTISWRWWGPVCPLRALRPMKDLQSPPLPPLPSPGPETDPLGKPKAQGLPSRQELWGERCGGVTTQAWPVVTLLFPPAALPPRHTGWLLPLRAPAPVP